MAILAKVSVSPAEPLSQVTTELALEVDVLRAVSLAALCTTRDGNSCALSTN
jgi:hypothetical protein